MQWMIGTNTETPPMAMGGERAKEVSRQAYTDKLSLSLQICFDKMSLQTINIIELQTFQEDS